jgi:hypothetical protein
MTSKGGVEGEPGELRTRPAYPLLPGNQHTAEASFPQMTVAPRAAVSSLSIYLYRANDRLTRFDPIAGRLA